MSVRGFASMATPNNTVSQKRNGTKSEYRPHIDGLRAIAILLVLFYHAGLGVSGGFIGVDIFFVISGYLISKMIIQGIQANTFSIVTFWEHRIRRLMPALFCVMIFTIVAGWFLFLPDGFMSLNRVIVSQLFYSANIYLKKNTGGYFDQPSHENPMLHMWSLSVEEQFYLVFPVLCLVLLRTRFGSKIPLRVWLLAGWIISFCLSSWSAIEHPKIAFYFLRSRAWELLTGSILATIEMESSRFNQIKGGTAWIGLAMIAFAAFFLDASSIFPGFAALLPCMGAALILWAAFNEKIAFKKILELPVFVFIGKISYSLYLWHWILFAFANYWMGNSMPLHGRFFLVFLSFLLGYISYRWVETPFRLGPVISSRKKAFVFAASGTILCLFLATAIVANEGFPCRFSKEVLAFAAVENERNYVKEMSAEEIRNGGGTVIGFADATNRLSFIVWGDSHAMAILPAIHAAAIEKGTRGVAFTRSATAPVLNFAKRGWRKKTAAKCMDYNRAVADRIIAEKPRKIILVCRWDYCGGWKENYDSFLFHFVETVLEFQRNGIEVWFMRSVPVQTVRVADQMHVQHTSGLTIQEWVCRGRFIVLRLCRRINSLTGFGKKVLELLIQPVLCEKTPSFLLHAMDDHCIKMIII